MSDPAGVSPEEYKRARAKAVREQLEADFFVQFRGSGVPAPATQVKHVPGRAFRLDFAWPELKLGVEVDGGIKSRQKSHTSVGGILRDIEKHNSGIEQGWTVIRLHTDMVYDGSGFQLVKRVYERFARERVFSFP